MNETKFDNDDEEAAPDEMKSVAVTAITIVVIVVALVLLLLLSIL